MRLVLEFIKVLAFFIILCLFRNLRSTLLGLELFLGLVLVLFGFNSVEVSLEIRMEFEKNTIYIPYHILLDFIPNNTSISYLPYQIPYGITHISEPIPYHIQYSIPHPKYHTISYKLYLILYPIPRPIFHTIFCIPY